MILDDEVNTDDWPGYATLPTERTLMPHPIDAITKAAAERDGWDVANAGEARVALALQRLGYRPADVFTQFRIGSYRLDFALVAERIDIEADGWVHTARDVRRRDTARDRQLREWGWTVIRLDLSQDVEEQVRRKVPDRASLPDFDATMRQIWAVFGLAVSRLTQRGIADPAERLGRVRDALRAALNDPAFLPPKRDSDRRG